MINSNEISTVFEKYFTFCTHFLSKFLIYFNFLSYAAQRAKISKKVHKPHYIEWSDFSDVGLNCEYQGEKGRTCRKYKILIESQVSFFLFIPLNSEGRFVNLFGDFSPVCDGATEQKSSGFNEHPLWNHLETPNSKGKIVGFLIGIL